MPAIKDDYRKNITAIMLENQEKALREAEIANHSGVDSVFGDTSGAFNSVGGFNPVLISLVRRAMPNLIAYDVCGVQPMSGPTGLIFAMKAKFGNHGSAEALFDEAPTGFGATPALLVLLMVLDSPSLAELVTQSVTVVLLVVLVLKLVSDRKPRWWYCW